MNAPQWLERLLAEDGPITVVQFEVLTRGRRLWAIDPEAGLFECFAISEKQRWDERIAGHLDDIRREGRVYGPASTSRAVNRKRSPGALTGKIRMDDDFDATPAEVIEDFEASS